MIERYYLKAMKDIWGEKNYYRKWVEIEAAFLEVRGYGDLAREILSMDIEPEDVREGEKTSGHELNSFLEILISGTESPDSGEIHKGLTSSDVMDTARVMQMKESLRGVREKLESVRDLLRRRALEYKDTVTCGRTHGQYAEPLSLGLKFARWYAHASRNIQRIDEAGKRILTGTISGAVGTYSLVTPEEEEKVLDILGLKPSPAPSQILPRDPFAEYLFIHALAARGAAEIALEIRLLSQDGIKEAAEPFTEKQKGSSAMPHKKNPVICERICGLARLVSSNVTAALENIELWNERDISHSSNERLIIEDSSSLTYYILEKLEFVLEGLEVNRENIDKALEAAGPRLCSSAVLKLLLESGLRREEAYRKAQEVFMSGSTAEEIINTLVETPGLEEEALREALSPAGYLKNIDAVYGRLGLI